MSELERWLREHGLDRYASLLAENAIDLDVLPDLTDAELEKLGVPLGDRKRLLKATASLKSSPARTEVASEAPAPPQEAERRQLTIMFCDLVGSTELSSQLDPEDFREVVKAYQEACAAVVARFEGHVAKYLGDGLLVYFGYPQAHEDDAERAVHAGLGIVEAMSTLEPRPGLSLATRIGIATGRVVAGDLVGERISDEQAVLGDVPNLAARLQGIAEPNNVVISDATRRLAVGAFDYDDVGAQKLKGMAEPVQVWRAISERAVESRFEARQAQLTEFVGREHEIGLLLDRWKQATGGEGQVVLLSGEAGIGKSRITQRLHEQLANDPHTRLRYQCSPHHTNSALYPAIRQLEFAARFAPNDTPERKLDKLEELLGQSARAVADVMPLFAALLSIPTGDRYPALSMTPERQRERTLEALAEQLVGLAGQQPVLFVLEDAHWIDPTTRELMDLTTTLVADAPVLIVITFRPEFLPQWQAHGHVTTLTLNRVTRQQSAAIITAIAGDMALPDGLVEHIVEKSDGVPLFIEELTRSILETGIAGTDAQPSRFAVPTTLQDALAARLDRMLEVKEVAQIGAVIGREFTYDLLAATADCPEEQLADALGRLVSAELIFRRGMSPETTYVFKHALVRDAAYESLLKNRRRELHTRLAQVLEERFAPVVEGQPELLAHHLTEAGLVLPAVGYWLHAGEKANDRAANAEAAGHLTRGLDLLPAVPDGPERDQQELALLTALGRVLTAARAYTHPEVVQVYSRAQELSERIGETPHLFPVLLGLAIHHVARSELGKAQELSVRLLGLAQRTRDPVLLVEAHYALGVTCFLLGDFTSARQHLERGSRHYDVDQHRAHLALYGQDGGPVCMCRDAMTLWCLGYPDRARSGMEEALDVTLKLGHPFSRAYVLGWAAILHMSQRDVDRANEFSEATVTAATEHGFPFWQTQGTFLQGWVMAERGATEAGIERMKEGLAGVRRIGARMIQPSFLGHLGDVCGRSERTEDGLVLLDDGLKIVAETGQSWFAAELHRLKGELLLRDRAAEAAAEASFLKAIEIAQGQSAKAWELRAAASLARLLQAQSKSAEARDLLAPVYNWFTEGFDTLDLKETKVLLDELA